MLLNSVSDDIGILHVQLRAKEYKIGDVHETAMIKKTTK